MKQRGIYKRGNIYWLSYAGLDSKVVRESSGKDDYDEALSILLDRRKAVKEGREPDIPKITNTAFNELIERYCEWMIGRHKSAQSKLYRIKQVKNHFGEHVKLKHFSTLSVEQYQTHLINTGLQNGSVNKNIGLIKAMFTKAVEWEMVHEDVLKKVRKVKQLKENKRLRYLAKEEMKELVNSCEPHLKPIVIMALNAGMRKSEILTLKWDNVDLIHINPDEGIYGWILLDKTKNNERRELPINLTLRSTLDGITRRLDVPYVYYQKTGKRYQDIKRSFGTACRRSKIRDFHFHDLRHTFASQLAMAGVPIATISKLLGHKDIKTTMRYSHLSPSHLGKALDILDQTINNSGSTSHQKCTIVKKELTVNG